MMSVRGSRPKMSSDIWTEPASLPSNVVIFNSMSRTFLRGGGGFRRGRLLGRRVLCFADPEFARLRRILRQRLLHRIAHGDPAAFGTRHRALDQNEATLDIGLHDLEVEGGDAIDAHVARHLLVLEGLAGVLPAAGRADRAMRNRNTVRGAQAAEIPPLHAAGIALTDRDAADINELTGHEMI